MELLRLAVVTVTEGGDRPIIEISKTAAYYGILRGFILRIYFEIRMRGGWN